MIMPFIRLVSIYIIVIVAAVAFFKRDQIMEMTGWSFDWPASQEVAQNDETATNATAETTAETATAPVETPAPAKTAQAEPVAKPTPAKADTAIKTPQPAQAQVQQAATTQPAPQASAQTTQSRLNAARQSFWNGDLAGAEVLYAALAIDAPTNPDVNGELGNVLYAQRKYDAAADAYLTTGKLLVGSGNPAQILPLISVLQSIAPQKAATLHALMAN